MVRVKHEYETPESKYQTSNKFIKKTIQVCGGLSSLKFVIDSGI
jgi:hypothetical protein